jgi:hypothetical protein
MKFSKEELQAVVKWLENRHEYLHNQILIIECGDDAALANGKGPLLKEIDRERWANRLSLNTARDQLDESH